MKKLWLFRVYRGWKSYQVTWGLFHNITHEIRIPIKQPGFNGKYLDWFFSLLNWYQIELYIWLKWDAALQQSNIAMQIPLFQEEIYKWWNIFLGGNMFSQFQGLKPAMNYGKSVSKMADLMGFSGSFAFFWGKMDLKRTP